MEHLPNYDNWLEAPYQRRCDQEEEAARTIEQMDDFDGWMQWLEKDDVAEDFEVYCFENFWNVLGEDFKSHLHPDTVREMDPSDPLGDNWPVWSLFLFMVIDRKRLEILVSAFVNSNRDAFEEWVLA